ncbi:MAG: hypothetical protein JWL58_2293 [Streptosporangiaceae bacterium]|nr:hypothetical protein [Streptosporangiaceae bacterium]
MPGSAVFETAVGLVLQFALLSLLCSALCEALSSRLQMRSKFLLSGLRLMLDRSAAGASTRMLDAESAQVFDAPRNPPAAGDESLVAEPAGLPAEAKLAQSVKEPEKTAAAAKAVNDLAQSTGSPEKVVKSGGMTLALFGHPLLQSLQTRRGLRRGHGGVSNPAYVSAQSFARALIDTLVPDSDGRTSLETVRTTVEGLPDGLPAKKSLLALLKRAQGSIATFENLIEEWYDDQMQRVSGWYKRWARVVLFCTGLFIAILANVDTLQVAHDLYLDQPIRQAVITQANTGNLCQNVPDRAACADQELTRLSAGGVPIWWPDGCGASDVGRCFRLTTGGHTGPADVAFKLAGWLLTAFGVSFGAPFWFEALSRLGSLRATGPKPSPTTP